MLGRAYTDGNLTIEGGGPYELLELLALNLRDTPVPAPLQALRSIQGIFARGTSIRASMRNVSHHYDLSRSLYEAFLDSDLQYSCAYFKTPYDTLEVAQQNKKQRIISKLHLCRPDLRVLDIGSGWGGLVLEIARQSSAGNVTGLTLSKEQLEFSRARLGREPPLQSRVQFHLKDYREEIGIYDRVTSVGMLEHVGPRNYRLFFSKLASVLAAEGVALIHTIGYTDRPGPINPFIERHVFPGAALPSMSQLAKAIEASGLIITDVEILRLHYAETLSHWRNRFMENVDKVCMAYDASFCRMWEFYLALCEIGFRYRTMVVFQIQLTKRIETLPTTRDYMCEGNPEPSASR
jgi:cyclopropane-fatty-acyl-phospholipid synthase